MIITRTPLRISLGGGGTDLPSYYRVAGPGFLIAAAISRHVYVAVHRNFDPEIILKYSEVERVSEVAAIRHPLLRESLAYVGLDSALEVTSMADIPAGTGLGSSGAFTVGLLKALYAYRHRNLPNEEIARAACEIAIERLAEPVGKQDEYIAACGGLTAFEFRADGSVVVEPVSVRHDVRESLEENLLLFFTGVRRPASEVLAHDHARASATGDGLIDNLTAVRALGYQTRDALVRGDLSEFGQLLTAQWKLKYERSPSEMHGVADAWIEGARIRGAAGGKLVGAGGGGFLLFYAEDKAPLRTWMAEQGLTEVRFSFDNVGSTTLVAS